MSYNINSVYILSSDGFRAPVKKLLRLQRNLEKNGEYVAELNPFDELDPDQEYYEPTNADFPYSGTGSGYAEHLLVDKILPLFEGKADLLFTWEGGKSFSGVRVVNGKVTRHEVVQALGQEI